MCVQTREGHGSLPQQLERSWPRAARTELRSRIRLVQLDPDGLADGGCGGGGAVGGGRSSIDGRCVGVRARVSLGGGGGGACAGAAAVGVGGGLVRFYLARERAEPHGEVILVARAQLNRAAAAQRGGGSGVGGESRDHRAWRRGWFCGCSVGAVREVMPRRRGGGGHGSVPAEHELHAVRCGALLAPRLLLPCRELPLPSLHPLHPLLCLLALCLPGALLDRGNGRERDRLAGLDLGLRLLRASRARRWEWWVHGGRARRVERRERRGASWPLPAASDGAGAHHVAERAASVESKVSPRPCTRLGAQRAAERLARDDGAPGRVVFVQPPLRER